MCYYERCTARLWCLSVTKTPVTFRKKIKQRSRCAQEGLPDRRGSESVSNRHPAPPRHTARLQLAPHTLHVTHTYPAPTMCPLRESPTALSQAALPAAPRGSSAWRGGRRVPEAQARRRWGWSAPWRYWHAVGRVRKIRQPGAHWLLRPSGVWARDRSCVRAPPPVRPVSRAGARIRVCGVRTPRAQRARRCDAPLSV